MHTQRFFYVVMLFITALCGSKTQLCAQIARVEATPVISMEFADQLRIQGNVESVKVAKVSARAPGPIEAIFVDEGDAVIAEQTRLFQIDATKLRKITEIRQQELAIASFSLAEKEARLKQANADLEKALSDMNRSRLLWEDNSISADNREKAQLRYKVSQAAVEHTQALIDLSREQLKQAEFALKIAEKDFADSTVYAPISGRVVSKLQEAGEMAAPGMPIILLKDPQLTEISAHLPAAYYHRVISQQTEVLVSSITGAQALALVTFKSPVINPQLRTFAIKVANKPNETSMIPGALAEITVILSRRTNLAVPVKAIVNRAGGKVIFVVKQGKAKMVTIITGLENDGLIEAISPELKPGDLVVTSGQNLLNDSQAVTVETRGQ